MTDALRRSMRSPVVPSKKRVIDAPATGGPATRSRKIIDDVAVRAPLPVLALMLEEQEEDPADVDFVPAADEEEPAEEFNDADCVVERGDDVSADVENVADADLLDELAEAEADEEEGEEYAASEADSEDDASEADVVSEDEEDIDNDEDDEEA